MVRPLVALRVLLTLAVLAVPTGAGAAPLPSSATPLPGSSFQGADGDQDDQAPYADWQALQGAGRVVHTADPNAADTAFTGGAKEDAPGAWDLTTEKDGVDPGKANILDAWSALDQPDADTFLYLGFVRAEANGTTYLTFELNQDARLWDNGHATIPCRRTGDLLVAFEAQGNGMSVVLQRWRTATTDSATGCARTGSVDEVATAAASAAQGAVNAGAITSRLPGAYAPPAAIPTGQFGEAALNLSALLTAAFHDRCFAFGSIWMHSRSSTSESAQMQDYLAPHGLAVRSCAAEGTKFFDANADGQRDSGERGIARFLIWADYDGDGARDAGEPYTVTDRDGHYVLEDIRPPGGTYTLRETLLTRRRAGTSWVCSFPHADTPGGFGDGPGGLFGCGWGPITAADAPVARGRDFGNWLPAQLTVEKQLWPADDPGRFDLIVNGTTVLAGAGDGASTTIAVPPGTYDVTEAAVPPTDAGAYRSTATCHLGLVLRAGEHATCTFINVRPGTPAIAIEKTGPGVGRAGETLHYTLAVTNPGDVPFPAGAVTVADPVCDGEPGLRDKGGDGSPQTLDPGDTWTYECSHRTAAPTADCRPSLVRNTATVSVTAGGATISDDSSLVTDLGCPGTQLEPQPPGATSSPGAEPPAAGRAGVAGLEVRGGCIARLSQVRLAGTRISALRVRVDGRAVRRATLRILQRRASVLPRLFAPGRHRLSVSVTFERGSGTPPVTLSRTVTVCAAPRPRPDFTG